MKLLRLVACLAFAAIALFAQGRQQPEANSLSCLSVSGSPTDYTCAQAISGRCGPGLTVNWTPDIANGSNPTLNTGCGPGLILTNEGTAPAASLFTSGIQQTLWYDGRNWRAPALVPTASGGTVTGSLNATLGIAGVPFCTGFTPTSGQALAYTTTSSPSPCWTASTISGTGADANGYYWVSGPANAPTNGINLGALLPGVLKITVSGGVATPGDAVAADIYGLWSGCSPTNFLRGDGVCAIPNGSGTVNSGTGGRLAYYPSTGTAISDMGADFTWNGTHSLVGGSSSILDLHAAGTGGLLLPGALSTGLVKVTTLTGAISIAAVGDITALTGTGSGAQSTFGLGSAALQSTGTSGTTLPFLNGTNTWSGTQFFGGVIGAAGTVNFSDSTHTLPSIVVAVAGSLPGTCTAGELGFVTGATAGQNIYECGAANVWTQQLNSGGGGGGGTVTVVGSGNLVNTAVMTGGGSTEAQTASATTTLDGNGNFSTPGTVTAASFVGSAHFQASGGTEASPTVSSPTIWFDSSNNLLQYKNASNVLVGTMVANLAVGTAHKWVSYIDGTGTQQLTQPAISDLTATFTAPLTLNTNTLSIAGVSGQVLAGSPAAFTGTPALGTDNVVSGTLQLANGAANAHTIWASAATTTNIIAGFATAPANGDLLSCTTASTTCVLTDAGFLASAVIRESATDNTASHVLHATGANNVGTFSALLLNEVAAAAASSTIANGNNPITWNWAQTTGSQAAFTLGETTAATGSGDIGLWIKTLTTSTAIPLEITQGAAGPSGAAAPNVLNISAAAAGGAAGTSSAGNAGAAISLLTGAGSAGGATTGNGGSGGSFSLTLGAGGAHGGNTANTGGPGGGLSITPGAGTQGAATGAGGAAGTLTLAAAAGGAGGSTSGTGGAGSDFLVTTGTGGAATAGSTTGRGGNVQFTLGSAGGTGTAGAPGQLKIIGGTVAGSNTTPFLNLTGTWNTSGVVDAAIFANITNTASAAGSKLIDLQIGGASQFSVDSAGNLALGTSISVGGPPVCITGTAGTLCLGEGTGPTTAAAVDQIWADSDTHSLRSQVNGGSPGTVDLVMPGAIRSIGLVADVSTATLCASAAGACDQAGTYHVHVALYQSGTACSANTINGVTPSITWTDANGTAHSAQTVPMVTNASTTALSGTMAWGATTLGAWGSGDMNIDTDGTVIQYAIAFADCTTGSATYAASLAVTRLE